MQAEHADIGSDAEAAMAVTRAEEAKEGSMESAFAGATFEREHVKHAPEDSAPQGRVNLQTIS